MLRPAVVVLLLLAPALSGCADVQEFFGRLTAPDARVQITQLVEGDGAPGDGPWNRESRFLVRVLHDKPLPVRAEATSLTGQTEAADSPATAATFDSELWTNEADLRLGDGIWDIRYFVDGRRWGSLDDVHIDGTPPQATGLELVGDASGGSYAIGRGASVEADTKVQVYAQATGALVGTGLPTTVSGLGDGIKAFTVLLEDRAGNTNAYTVQVRVGSAQELPAPKHTAGIIARYTNEARLWDLSDPDAYLMPAAARQAVGGKWLSAGYGVAPNDPQVKAIAESEFAASMTTMELALALYERLFDDFEYIEERLQEEGLQTPAETIDRQGGVCRDLAALYVSLVRAVGVPARLVTGYLGGEDPLGFHAWVEVYVGVIQGNPGPWLPIDVSPIDGRWTDASPGAAGLSLGQQTLLSSFGIRNPEYLQLRTLPESAEVAGWSTALSYATSYRGPAPQVDFATVVTNTITPQSDDLCVDTTTYARRFGSDCTGHSHRFGGFPVLVEQVIDYGFTVQGGSDATIQLEASFPFALDIAPDEVQPSPYGLTYGAQWDRDLFAGKVEATLTR